MSRPGLDEPTECPRARRGAMAVASRCCGARRTAAGPGAPTPSCTRASVRWRADCWRPDRVGRWSANRRRTPLIAQAVVCGEGRPYPVALLALDEPEVRAWAAARPRGRPRRAVRRRRAARRAATRARRGQRAPRPPGSGKRFALLPRPLSVERGELTPSLKLRRAIVAGAFAETIEDLYARTPEEPTCLTPSVEDLSRAQREPQLGDVVDLVEVAPGQLLDPLEAVGERVLVDVQLLGGDGHLAAAAEDRL